jgi:hypothetical protein
MRKIRKSIMLLVVLSAFILLGACRSVEQSPEYEGKTIAPVQSDYPHWNFNNWKTYKKLVKINTFIEINKDKGKIAVFDWDGTLYNENIPVKEMKNEKFAGQPAFYIWAAYNSKMFPFKIFPMFSTKDGEFQKNVIEKDKYLEGRTNIQPDQYSKFTQTSIFTAGMTPENMSTAVMKYLDDYSPNKYAFLPMLDILQKFTDSGYDVWIVTGSNQYFVAAMLKYIEKNINYTKTRKYDFKLATVPYNPETGHIAGNALKVLDNNTFSVVYDNRYVKNSENKLYIVDHEGKVIVVKNLEKKAKSKVMLVAGNSGGDYDDTKYVVSQSGTLAISVVPSGTLKKLAADNPDKIVTLDSDEI